MRTISLAVATFGLISCGQSGDRYVIAANHDVLIVVSDLQVTSDPNQKQAIVHYSTSPSRGVNGLTKAASTQAFDCATGKVFWINTIQPDGAVVPAAAETWEAPTPRSMGDRTSRILCDQSALKKAKTGKSVAAIERAWSSLSKAARD